MNTLAGDSHPANTAGELPVPFLVALLAAAVLLFGFGEFHFSKVSIIILVGLPLLGLMMFSFDVMVLAFVATLFSTQDVFLFKVAVPFTIPVVAAFFATHSGVRLRDFRTGVTGALFVYLAAMLPSLANSPDRGLTLLYMLNYVLFGAGVLVLSASLHTHEEITRPLRAFVLLSALNALYVIVSGVSTGRREFGFPGIVFVDFAPIVILLLLTYVIFTPGWKRYGSASVLVIVVASLLMGQTRNTLITLGGALALFTGYLLKNNHLVGYSRKKLALGILFGLIACGTAIGLAWVVAPGTFERLTHLNQRTEYEINNSGDFALNSLLTRILIWMTAWQAFLAHPVIGIGAFSFPFTSKLYSTIPPDLYIRYVKGAGPHITYLALLAETGVVGFLGFIFLLWKTLKIAFQSMKLSEGRSERTVSACLLAAQLYICLSMFGTDAWLWGQCGMLWCLLLGLSLANRRMLLDRHTLSVNE